MIIGLYPPSSRTVRLRVRPARSASIRAVLTPPMRLMHRTSGLAKNSSAIAAAAPGACGTTLITPAGKPASSAISATTSPAEIGANSEGLTTTVQPAASGFSTARHGLAVPAPAVYCLLKQVNSCGNLVLCQANILTHMSHQQPLNPTQEALSHALSRMMLGLPRALDTDLIHASRLTLNQ